MEYSKKTSYFVPRKKRKIKKEKIKRPQEFSQTNEVSIHLRNYNSVENIIDNEILKYWKQRYSIFSRYDEGIQMDREAWYSATPEAIGIHIAKRCACNVIIDAFCGVGGNAIHFATTCQTVIAIDIDEEKIRMAKHNASIYGVDDRIEFVVGDFLKLAPFLKADVVFLSPPWGGPHYQDTKQYNLHSMIPDGFLVFQESSRISPNIAYLLPRNVNTTQLIELLNKRNSDNSTNSIQMHTVRQRYKGECEMEQNILNGHLKTITVYYGVLIREDSL